MKQKIQLYILLTCTLFTLSGLTQLFAADEEYTLGGETGQLKITIFKDGLFCVYRRNQAGDYKQQFAVEKFTRLFAIKIGNTVYSTSSGVSPAEQDGTFNSISAITQITNIEDLGAVTTGTNQEVTKKFSGSYGGNPFSVTLRITYNTTSPDYFIMHASIDASSIPSGTEIKFAHGFDSCINGYDIGVAYIAPDLGGSTPWNNPPTIVDRYLTTEQVQQLRMVGSTNLNAFTQGGSFIALFPIGRNFDRAYSAGDHYWYGNGHNIVELTQGTGNHNNYKFQFGPFNVSSGNDNGVGAGYDGIRSGEVTEIRTGLTFTNTLDGELDYQWNNQKTATVNAGEVVNLNLSYTSHGSSTVSGIGFRANFGGLKITTGGCSSSGFSAPGTSTCANGNEYYQLSGASVASGTASITVPLNTTRAGRWVIAGDSITETLHTLPFGPPAVLTVNTTVSLPDDNAATVAKGGTKPFTVQFPAGVTATEDVTIGLSYTGGGISSFSSMPASVTIPAGQNSATFAVVASSSGADGATITITLNVPNPDYVTVAAPSSVQLSILTNHTVTYVGNDHTGGTPPAQQTHASGSSVPLAAPGSMVRTCHVFLGWATASTATTPNFAYNGTSFTPPSFTITGDTTFYAVWRDATSIVWTPSTSVAIGERTNWNNPMNWTPQVVPMACSNVYIPGKCDYYPELTTANTTFCNNIYFIQGAELGRPDLLTYEKAFIQYNFGLLQTTQNTSLNSASVFLANTSTTQRMQYSAATSDPLDRERWYMFSSPLRGVVTGDLSFGGFPLTFLMKFDPVHRAGQSYSVGNWTTPYTSVTEPVVSPPSVTEGFAFYMYGYDGSSSDPNRNLGCDESGAFNNPAYKDPTYFPFRSSESYGIAKTNGILELPFFADSTNLFAHRTQIYNHPAANRSTFYFAYDGSGGSTFNSLSGDTDLLTRESNNGNYRFAPETYNSGSGKWVFDPLIYHPVSELSSGDEFLAGNPYMSSIDMVEFCKDNGSSVDPLFRIWNGNSFDDHSVNVSTGVVTPTNPNNTNRYIAPLQGFFLTYGTGAVRFDVTKISTVRPSSTSFNLRSAGESGEENTLRIKAENSSVASYSVIKYKEGADNTFSRGKDVQKLFSPYSYVPEIYALAGETPASIRFINNNSNEIIVPLGIKTGQTGEIRLTFSGMDNYDKASKIELFDAKENRTIDLTGKTSYTYSFNNTETGIQNGRFSLRFDQSPTSLQDVNVSDNPRVYGDSKGIYVITSSSDPVQKLEIYDFQGRKLYESASGASYYPLRDNFGHLPLIVKVATANAVTSYKLRVTSNN